VSVSSAPNGWRLSGAGGVRCSRALGHVAIRMALCPELIANGLQYYSRELNTQPCGSSLPIVVISDYIDPHPGHQHTQRGLLPITSIVVVTTNTEANGRAVTEVPVRPAALLIAE